MEVSLVRLSETDGATLGTLVMDGFPEFATLEPPWKNNEKNVSCIPEGEYRCVKVRSPKFGVTFEVVSVPDREFIRFHEGNWAKNTKGCPLLGLSYRRSPRGPMITQSVRAMERFMKKLDGEGSFTLRVVRAL